MENGWKMNRHLWMIACNYKKKYTKGENSWDGLEMARVTGEERTCRDWKCGSGFDGLAPALLPLLEAPCGQLSGR